MAVKSVVKSIVNDGDREKRDEAHRKRELDAQRAIDETGFGKFNYKVIAVGGLLYMNVTFCIPNLGFILPSAACDFRMDTIAMDRLGTAQIMGMMCGSCLWGCLADTKGRRMALSNCLFFQAFVDTLAAISSNYWAFLVLKFFTGLSLSGQLAIIFTYIGEFQSSRYRTIVLAAIDIPGILGLVLPPLVAWLIIPLDIELTYSFFSFKSWNLFVIIMSAMPAFLVGCILSTMPETPKYLASTGRYNELRKVLTNMYCQNTGNTAEEYIAKLDQDGIIFSKNTDDESDNDSCVTIGRTLTTFLKTLYTQTGILVRQPYIGRTLKSFTANCIIVTVYTVTLWFPEIFQRLADYENRYPDERADICIASRSIAQQYQQNLSHPAQQTEISDLLESRECVVTIDTQVYVDTLILGLSCIPVTIIFMLTVSRLGFRFFLAIDSLITSVVTFSMIYVKSSTQSLILSCIWEAFISVSITAMSCLFVEIYPTHLRVTASALAALFGRLSAFLGNIIFGYLLDNHCVALFTILAVELFVSAVLCTLIPKEGKGKPAMQQQATEDISNIESHLPVDENPSNTAVA